MKHFTLSLALAACLTLPGGVTAQSGETPDLTDKQMEELVKRSYQYVAMYNVNQKIALAEEGMSTRGYNKGVRNTDLLDHSAQMIARPNNDVLYQVAMMDLRKDAVVLKFPAMESKYVSLLTSGYDHYVEMPLSTVEGDFREPRTVLFYYEYSALLLKRDKIKVGALPTGEVKIAYEMKTPPQPAGPAELTFWINGKEAAKGTVQRTVPLIFTASETLDVGMDTASPVADDYFDKAPFKFEGALKRLHFTNL